MLKFFNTANKAYDILSQNLYQTLLFQTRLQPYLNEIGLKIENDGFVLDYSGVAAKFGDVFAQNPEKAFVDLGEFIAFGSQNSGAEELASLMAQYAKTAVENGTFEQYAQILGAETLAKLGHKLGGEGDDRLNGNELANLLLGGKGNDTLYGYGDGDYLEGGTYEADTYLCQRARAGHRLRLRQQSRAYRYADFEDGEFYDAVFSRFGNNLVVNAYGSGEFQMRQTEHSAQ